MASIRNTRYGTALAVAGILVCLVAGALSVIRRAEATHDAGENRLFADQIRLQQARQDLARAFTDELTATLARSFGLVDDATVEAARDDRVTTRAHVEQTLEVLAQARVGLAPEIEAMNLVLADYGPRGDSSASPDELYDGFSIATFEGRQGNARMPAEVGLHGLTAYEQLITLSLAEAVAAHMALGAADIDARSPEVSEYLATLFAETEGERGYFGPGRVSIVDAQALDLNAVPEYQSNFVDGYAELLIGESLWATDQWLQTIDADASEPPFGLAELHTSTIELLATVRDSVDAVRADALAAAEADADASSRTAMVATILATLAFGSALVMVIAVARRQRRRARLLERLATTDQLTGLANRYALDRASELVSGGSMLHHVGVTIDLDQFKIVNDLHGHAVGDRMLCTVADGLREIIDTTPVAQGVAVRLGGDEFFLSLHSATPIDTDAVRDRLDALRTTVVVAGNADRVPVRFSYGLTEVTGATTLRDLLDTSDLAAYESKSSRRRLGPSSVERLASDDAESGQRVH
jgi:diguanylate cyclase (GGDEF)-like protein